MSRQRWAFDEAHSRIGFSVRHMMFAKVHGLFSHWSGFLEMDDQNPQDSSVHVVIDASSIDTSEDKRDAHLRSPEFFDVAQHPHLLFRSTSVESTGEGAFRLRGDLTIRGVTRPVQLEVEYGGRGKDPWGKERIGFTARTAIHRKDFGLTWNQALEAGGWLVGDKVEIGLEVEATLTEQPQPELGAQP